MLFQSGPPPPVMVAPRFRVNWITEDYSEKTSYREGGNANAREFSSMNIQTLCAWVVQIKYKEETWILEWMKTRPAPVSYHIVTFLFVLLYIFPIR